MEDVIYIVIGLLWLVFTFYTQSKKKKQREAQKGKPASTSSETPKSFFEQLFADQPATREPNQEVLSELDLEYQDVAEKEKSPSSFVEEYEKMGIKSLEDTQLKNYGTNVGGTGVIEQENEQDFDPEMIVEEKSKEGLEFDLRRAVIMAEILERPYS